MKRAHHHRFADLPADSPMPQILRRRVTGDKAQIDEIRVQAGCKVPSHQHDNEQFAIVLSGRLRFTIGDPRDTEAYTVEVEGGGVLHLPPGVPHAAEVLEDAVVYDVFCPPAESTGIDG